MLLGYKMRKHYRSLRPASLTIFNTEFEQAPILFCLSRKHDRCYPQITIWNQSHSLEEIPSKSSTHLHTIILRIGSSKVSSAEIDIKTQRSDQRRISIPLQYQYLSVFFAAARAENTEQEQSARARSTCKLFSPGCQDTCKTHELLCFLNIH